MPPSMDGQDLSHLVMGELERIGGLSIDGGWEVVFSCLIGVAELRSGTWKYMRPGLWWSRTAVFDLEADVGEQRDLRRERTELVEQLDNRLEQLVR